MAMTKEVLGPLIQAKIDALPEASRKERAAIFEAIADAVISHIQTAATIPSLAVVATVTAGGAPVAGTASGVAGCIL